MWNFIVPRRTRAIVAVVIAARVIVIGEPAGVIVNPLARAVRRNRTGFAVCAVTLDENSPAAMFETEAGISINTQ